ncbi:MAG: hypothetical protein ABIN48_11245 [Ginsengibacter sp.]
MKKITTLFFLSCTIILLSSCSSSKNSTDLKTSTRNLSGVWTITDITLDLPSDFKVSDVFDEAPYQDFMNSKWDLKRNGKGFFALTNGTTRDIYWSVYGKGSDAQFQFKKLLGEKARNVDLGYRLDITNISTNMFVGKTPIDMGNGNTGYITYTFTK